MLNTSVHRCDALVVTTNGVSHVPLPDLELTELTDRVRTFWDAIAATTSPLTSPEDRKAADGHQVAALEWLWATTAGPVLDHLLPNRSGAAGTGGAGGTHCWWCLPEPGPRPSTSGPAPRHRFNSSAGAELAFLAACTTARQGTELLDEPVHLAAACQPAGFRQVIAALWPIDDADALRLTQRFYDRVLTEPSASASTALHKAMLRLRAIHPRRPTRWAPYVHFGRS